MRLEGDASLPWLRFAKLLHPEQDPGTSLRGPILSIQAWTKSFVDQLSLLLALTVASPREVDAPSRSLNQEVIQCLSSIVPWHRLSHPPNINSRSRTAAALSILMPEEYEGQHRDLSANI